VAKIDKTGAKVQRDGIARWQQKSPREAGSMELNSTWVLF
jgi:hypothetical protein